MLIASHGLAGVDALLRLAAPLADAHELVVACVVAPEELGSATAALATRRKPSNT